MKQRFFTICSIFLILIFFAGCKIPFIEKIPFIGEKLQEADEEIFEPEEIPEESEEEAVEKIIESAKTTWLSTCTENFNLSFSEPENWIKTETEHNIFYTSPDENGVIIFGKTTSSSEETLEDFTKNLMRKINSGSNFFADTESEFEINSLTVQEINVSYSGEPASKIEIIVFKNEDVFYKISYFAPDEYFSSYETIFNQIINSIKLEC